MVTIQPGSEKKIYTQTKGIVTPVKISVEGADISVSKRKNMSLVGDVIRDGQSEILAVMSGESIYAANESSTDTVDITTIDMGFFRFPFFQRNVNVNIDSVGVTNVPISIDNIGVTKVPIQVKGSDIDVPISIDNVGVANIPIAIDAQNISAIDMNLTGTTVTQDIDITTQTIAELVIDQTRRSSFGSVESNSDQTVDLADGNTDTTTQRANSGEQWLLQQLRVLIPDEGVQSGAANFIRVEIRTEAEGVTIAESRLDPDSGDNIGSLEFRAGEWVPGEGNPEYQRQSIRDIVIDDTNGIEFVFENQSSVTYDQTREFRASWKVIDI